MFLPSPRLYLWSSGDHRVDRFVAGGKEEDSMISKSSEVQLGHNLLRWLKANPLAIAYILIVVLFVIGQIPVPRIPQLPPRSSTCCAFLPFRFSGSRSNPGYYQRRERHRFICGSNYELWR